MILTRLSVICFFVYVSNNLSLSETSLIYDLCNRSGRWKNQALEESPVFYSNNKSYVKRLGCKSAEQEVHYQRIQRTLKRQPFNFLKVLKSLLSSTPSSVQKTTISQADKCVKNLKLEEKLENKTENNWTCKVLQDKTTHLDLICSCFYEYDCSETRRFYFSSQHNKDLEAENRLNKINRGADFQCERHLIKKTKSVWSCLNERNQAVSNVDDEFYCMCFRQKTCKYDRYYEID